jgi:acyl-CoA hydrolase
MNLNYQSADEALSIIKSGDRLFVQGSAATPIFLLHELEKKAPSLRNIEVISVSMLGDIGINKPEYANNFSFNALFVSEPIRLNVNKGNGDYIPVFLSEIHQLFEKNILPIDVALIQVSVPDKHGFCSLGVSVDVARYAVKYAKHVIAQVNPNMPRTHGDGQVHVSNINAFVYAETNLPEINYAKHIGSCEKTIGQHISNLIENGSTLQMGIGTIPDAVLQCLGNHQDLGIHTEMLSDGVIPLMESGVVNNKFKHKHRFKTATAFAIGTKKLYDFVDDNPEFAFLNAAYINDSMIIRSNPKVVAINSAIEIDLTGQVCADSIGTYQYSGVGGQMDFIRGAALSEGGKPIIAITSQSGKGHSKIVPYLKKGASVVTTRAHVHYVVTEYGVAYLFGKNLKQRAKALIEIAHPDFREELDKECFNLFG